MRTDTQTDAPVPVQVRLAAAWASLVLLYAYVDILGFYMPGVLDDIRAGVVWEFDITQTWASGALALMALPILMVVLSVTLPGRANRLTNLVVAPVYVAVSVGNAIGEAWTVFFALAVALEVFVLALVLRAAWTWPHRVTPDRSAVPSPAAPRVRAGPRTSRGARSRPSRAP